VKTTLICSFDVNEIVHKEFVPPGQTVNQYFYLDVLKRLLTVCDANGRNCGEVESGCFNMTIPRPTRLSLSDSSWRRATWFFCPTHPTRPTQLRATFLFPQMKKTLKGKRFSYMDEVKENTLTALKSIPCQEFQNCFQQWKKRTSALTHM
jgi:hypothetical protein